MAVQRPTKRFGVYLWDTFEKPGEDTYFLHETDTLDEATHWVEHHDELDYARFQPAD